MGHLPRALLRSMDESSEHSRHSLPSRSAYRFSGQIIVPGGLVAGAKNILELQG